MKSLRPGVVAAAALLSGPTLPAQLPHPTTGDLLVSSAGNDRLLRLAFDGRELAALRYPRLAHPRGIVVAKDGARVGLVSQNTGEVLVLDRSLRLVSRFATKGITSPTGAAFGPNGHLFVAGFSSHDVGEYRLDGTLVRTYSGGGLAGANCVAFAPDGSFYVASAFNGRVVRFDAKGRVLGSFTGFRLSSPMGIAVYRGEVYVAGGGSDNIAVFDLAGKPRRELKHRDLTGPQGIAFGRDGLLVSPSFYTGKLVFLSPDGKWVRTARPPSASVPRSVAFLHGLRLESSGRPTPGAPHPMRLVSPHEPGSLYAGLLSLSARPGLRLPDGRLVPLTPDALFLLCLTGAPGLRGFVGRLDAAGRADLTLLLPRTPALKGVTIHAGGVTIDLLDPFLVRQVAPTLSWTF